MEFLTDGPSKGPTEESVTVRLALTIIEGLESSDPAVLAAIVVTREAVVAATEVVNKTVTAIVMLGAVNLAESVVAPETALEAPTRKIKPRSRCHRACATKSLLAGSTTPSPTKTFSSTFSNSVPSKKLKL